MILRGIHFDPVHQASGATNFFGGGYPYHTVLRPFGLSFAGATFVSKTTTLLARPGNMPLKDDGITPREFVPKCIVVNLRKQAVLNAVSLSGPGLEALIGHGGWQRQRAPFFISVMSLAPTASGRCAELDGIFDRLRAMKQHERFRADWGVQLNDSCPNGGLDPSALIEEVLPKLDLADKRLPDTIPVMVKLGPETDPRSLLRIAKHPRADAFHFCNTMPFGRHPKWASDCGLAPIDWKGLYGSGDPKDSPLQKRFPGFAGGYSGKELLPFVLTWTRAVRALGIATPLCAGGGMLSGTDAMYAFDAGADAVAFGSIAMLAPTKVRSAIKFAHWYAQHRRTEAPRPLHPLEYNV